MESENIVEKNFKEIQIDNIKRFVDTQLDKLGLYNRLKNIVEDEDQDANEEKLIQRIRQDGLIDEIMQSFKGETKTNIKSNDNNINKDNKKCLFLKLETGKNFIDFANLSESTYFQFDILFLGQRFKTKKISCGQDFNIDESFLLDFNPMKLEIDLDLDRLKKLSSLIHIVLIKIEGEETTLIATKQLEWRWALCYGSWKIEAEMYSPATLNKLNVGIVQVF